MVCARPEVSWPISKKVACESKSAQHPQHLRRVVARAVVEADRDPLASLGPVRDEGRAAVGAARRHDRLRAFAGPRRAACAERRRAPPGAAASATPAIAMKKSLPASNGGSLARSRSPTQVGNHGIRWPPGRLRKLDVLVRRAPTSRFTIIATILGSVVVFLDATVVNVALPAISDDLGTGLADQQWVVEAYLLALVALLLVGGSLGDQFGRRRIFIIGLGLFGVTSILCGDRAEQRRADRGARPPGTGRCSAGPGLPGDPGCHLRGRRARQGGRHLDGLDGHRDRDRPGRRRSADRGVLLAGDLPGQRPADPGDDVDRPSLRPRERRSGGRSPHRLARDRLSAVGLGLPGLRPDRAADPRLGRPDGVRLADRGHRDLRVLPGLGVAATGTRFST